MAKPVTEKIVPIDNVEFKFICPKCKRDYVRDVCFILGNGIPKCDTCLCDMDISYYADVKL